MEGKFDFKSWVSQAPQPIREQFAKVLEASRVGEESFRRRAELTKELREAEEIGRRASEDEKAAFDELMRLVSVEAAQ